MPSTLTLDEFNLSREQAYAGIYDSILSYYQRQSAGIKKDGSEKIHEVLIYIPVLESWEQDAFNYANFTNFVDSNKIQQVFNRINKLI